MGPYCHLEWVPSVLALVCTINSKEMVGFDQSQSCRNISLEHRKQLISDFMFSPIALRTSKTLWSFDHSECNRVRVTEVLEC